MQKWLRHGEGQKTSVFANLHIQAGLENRVGRKGSHIQKKRIRDTLATAIKHQTKQQ